MINDFLNRFLFLTSPIFFLILTACFLILLECLKNVSFHAKYYVTVAGVVGSLLASFKLFTSTYELRFLHAPFATDGSIPLWFSAFSQHYQITGTGAVLFILVGLFGLISLFSVKYYFKEHSAFGEILILLMFVMSGLDLLVSSSSLLMLFLSLEFFSIPTYVLVGVHRKNKLSTEAALKYFLFGSFASALMLLGMAILFAQFGTLSLPQLANEITKGTSSPYATYGAMVLLAAAVLFKVGVVPFHMWVPDVYQGAPAPITGFMGSAIKLIGFVFVLKIFGQLFNSYIGVWSQWLKVIAVLSMFVGNLAALTQDNLKRIFAYSSVSHAGYLLLAVLSYRLNVASPIYYYLVMYGLMFAGLFGILSILEKNAKGSDIYEISGIGFSHPWLGILLTIFSLSAAGIPPTAGFFAKYYLFLDAMKAGYTWLVVLALLSSLIGVYFYLRVIVFSYMKEPREVLTVDKDSRALLLAVSLCALALFYFAFRFDLLQLY